MQRRMIGTSADAASRAAPKPSFFEADLSKGVPAEDKTINARKVFVMNRSTAKLLLGTSLATLLISAALAPAYAQTTAAPVAKDAFEEIVVTGSRIARPDLQAASPVSVLKAEALKQSNTVTVEQLLTSNPQFVANGTSASNNPGDGSATVDLRGLGSNRTLVLIDGKRGPNYDTKGTVDVNIIPTALIKRIEVLTGGASAVYGSDAISGVVNFILDDEFKGARADASMQISRYGDGKTWDASLTGGFDIGERGNFVVSAGYSKRSSVVFGDRPLNRISLDSGDLVTLNGSSNAVPTFFDTGGGRFKITPSGVLTDAIKLYNFNPVNYAQIPLERYNAMALFKYDLAENAQLYANATYIHTKTQTNLAATATAGFTFNIDPSNPFLTASERAVFFGDGATINDGTGVSDDPTARAGTSAIGIRRRMVETPGRQSDYKTDAYQILGGLRGDVFDNFKYDIFAQYSQSKRNTILKNDLSFTALQQSLDVVVGPGGVAKCFNAANGCVPFNLFTDRTISQAELAFVLRNAQQDTKITQFVTGASLSGDLGFLKSPLAAKSAAVSAGIEYRREKGSTLVDSNYASGDLIFYGQGQNIVGKYDVKEAYLELKMPLVEDKPFINQLGLEAGYRISDYSTSGTVSSYKIGGDWSPVSGLRFRGIYQRAVRAPNLNELYSPVVSGTGSLAVDPCAGPGISPTVAAICIAQGAPASRIGTIPGPISAQVNVFTGGNTALKAEKSDTFTVGFVASPAFIPDFTLTLDYYNIKINNAIDQVPPSVTANQCYVVDKIATSPSCASIVRNSLNGSLSGSISVGIPQQLGNIAVFKTSGIDLSTGWRGGDKDGFNYALSLSGTYTLSYDKQSIPGSDIVKCAGRFGSACNIEPIAKWKHVLGVDLGWKQFSFQTRWRYFGKVKQDVNTDILRSTIPAQNYFDQTLTFNVNEKSSLRFGIQNLFDKKSPIVGDTVGSDVTAGNTYPNTYDVIGRSYFVAVSFGF